ncbi:hypothetical protein D9M72_652610 [compost metagenome]
MDGGLGKLIGTEEAAERRAENQEREDGKQRRKRNMARHGPAIVQTEVPQRIEHDFPGDAYKRWHFHSGRVAPGSPAFACGASDAVPWL